jgi:hypothetical protein
VPSRLAVRSRSACGIWLDVHRVSLPPGSGTATIASPSIGATAIRLLLTKVRTRTGLSWLRTPCAVPPELVFSVPSGCSPVLADQAVDDVRALDPAGYIDRLAGFLQRRSLVPRLVFVIVLRVLGQDPPEVLFAVDQQVVQALAPQCSREPLRKGGCGLARRSMAQWGAR